MWFSLNLHADPGTDFRPKAVPFNGSVSIRLRPRESVGCVSALLGHPLCYQGEHQACPRRELPRRHHQQVRTLSLGICQCHTFGPLARSTLGITTDLAQPSLTY